MKYFPESDSQVQHSDARYGAAHPPGCDDSRQTIEAGFVRGVKQKVVVAPIAQAKKALRDPWHERQHQANLEAKNDIEDNAKLR